MEEAKASEISVCTYRTAQLHILKTAFIVTTLKTSNLALLCFDCFKNVKK
jgi:hypothetical protein